jgi:hypothetical protein
MIKEEMKDRRIFTALTYFSLVGLPVFELSL